MYFSPFIIRNSDGEKIRAAISPMKKKDAVQTIHEPAWQSNWTNEELAEFEKYSLKTEDGELVALGAYEILKERVCVHIVYIESQPESNPTMTKMKKYDGIGCLLIAFGIKLSIDNGCGGDVTFQAKTPELAKHYVKDFGAFPVSTYGGVAPWYALSREAEKEIFMTYLEEE